MIFGIQLIGILFGLVMIYFTHLYYKRNNYSKKAYVFWLATWIGVIVIFGIPEVIYSAMDFLAIQRTADFFTSIAIIFLTTLTFHMYGTVKKTEQRMERLVRKIALDTQEKPPKKKK